MTKLFAFVTVAVLALAASARAQQYDAAFFAHLKPGDPADRPGCVWQHDRVTGWYQSCGTPDAPTRDCRSLNPYRPEDAEAARRCNGDPGSTPAVVFRPGAQYHHVAYSETLRMTVLAVLAGSNGREVVVCQWLGDVAAQQPDPVFVLAEKDRGAWRRAQSHTARIREETSLEIPR